ncbi:MAG TPA: pyrimidine/purine nucleoside phosphorylase [Candidatus Agrococcus pullicola]|uniref:Pyrimidine/purine nucleoside phosphorylase n=1 Tax=Candidatus Agrococcus pullicola TaxID=2838429 RepID=A0A9D2C8U6_9MICO|nr:pyrimidine/purine nucleoside phosphorylase [Candidatus Agrococcus pullicola]
MIGQNEHYDGHVRSLEFANEQGKFTVGVMEPGEWTFEAPMREWMRLILGSWDVRQQGSDEWKTYGEGEQFQVEGDESFTVRISDTIAYLCPYT